MEENTLQEKKLTSIVIVTPVPTDIACSKPSNKHEFEESMLASATDDGLSIASGRWKQKHFHHQIKMNLKNIINF